MEPTQALRSIEIALRLAIRAVLGEQAWLSAPGAPEKAKLEERLMEERKRRDGALVSSNLIDYTETYHLTGIIEKNWQKFQPVFKDKARTSTYFGIIGDVRNSVAHSRDLLPFERDLIAGVSGQIRNQVSLYRSEATAAGKYYPLIETIVDNLGVQGTQGNGSRAIRRVEVGETINFEGAAFNATGKPVVWHIIRAKAAQAQVHTTVANAKMTEVAQGDSVSFAYTVQESDVHELFAIHVRIVAEGKYHRFDPGYTQPYDDFRSFRYSINPPDE